MSIADLAIGDAPVAGFIVTFVPPPPPPPPPPQSIPSSLNWDVMMLLGYSATQALYYDSANTESFYVLIKPASLFLVSPKFASQWFGSVTGVSTIYNPFGFNPTFPRSSLT